MKFQSTRDQNKNKYYASQVIKQGLASDGGLFVPETIPYVSKEELLSFSSLSYPELAAAILGKFLTDFTYDELLKDCQAAYSGVSFSQDVCPLVKVNKNTYSLELWHGPTSAFKDMALQIMPRLLSRSLVKTHEENTALVLVATSGDTGKAALEGYKDVDGVKICVFYPENGVSTVQKRQMTTQTGENVHVCAVKGNFDDIQSGVKTIFNDEDIKAELLAKGHFLSSANSINFGRLAPQIVYYFKAYCELISSGRIKVGEKINACVPTGNFGNILAAYMAKLMGLPIEKLICASNSNNILTDFLRTGIYDRNRAFYLTKSPSMDILISSNLERLLYLTAGCEKTVEWMTDLKDKGAYRIDKETFDKIGESFVGYCANEEETSAAIKCQFEEYGYLTDTHTAVAFFALEQYRRDFNDETITVVASTASPYKFATDVHSSLFSGNIKDGFKALKTLSSKTNTDIPRNLKTLAELPVRFSNVISPEKMYDEVLSFIEE